MLNLRKIVGVIIPLIGLVIIPFILPGYYTYLTITILTYICLVAAWNVISGYTGYLFLGATAFYGGGGYIAALLFWRLPFHLTVVIAGLICGFIAIILGLPLLRIRGPYFAIASFTLSEILRNLVYYLEHQFAGKVGRTLPVQDILLIYYTIIGITLAAVITVYYIREAKIGLALFCIRDDEDAAQACGINTLYYKLFAFFVTSFFMGLVGATTVARYGYIDADGAFNPAVSLNTAVMGLLGGRGAFGGPLISAVLLSILYEIFFSRGNPYPFGIVLAILLIIVIIFAPAGLSGLIQRLSDKIKTVIKSPR
ncbi:branched-chain amino acid ABC transporter permease [Candidatus Bathyarchaeota archaeon]|nr:branched-chain amino acid ABC transporter permease [Candidatus Bathyarchaeota archaeon]